MPFCWVRLNHFLCARVACCPFYIRCTFVFVTKCYCFCKCHAHVFPTSTAFSLPHPISRTAATVTCDTAWQVLRPNLVQSLQRRRPQRSHAEKSKFQKQLGLHKIFQPVRAHASRLRLLQFKLQFGGRMHFFARLSLPHRHCRMGVHINLRTHHP